ncbi:hypothetical protein N0V82_000847 [Gnomoniopsis sp. IMI 355080]|nr:hypothetical protein N0V82_000847 [Gnomoniopsis sp. IMI 355080]
MMGDAHNDDLKATFEQLARTGRIEKATSGKRAIQAHIAQEMLSLHKEQATTTMKAWAEFAELGSGRHHDTHFKSEADYIKYRMIDIGTMFWYGMVTFGMGISIPKEEVALAHELANVAYLNLGLTNDLYSYQKEYETAMAMGQDYVVNIIWVLMEEHGISEEKAKETCREKIKQTIVDFRDIVRHTNARGDVSNETKRYIEAMLYSLSGNLVWSIECPRYHSWASYNERQLDLMKNGIPSPENDNALQHPTDGTVSPESSRPQWHDSNDGRNTVISPANTMAPIKDQNLVHETSNGTGLVNVFARHGIKDLKAMRIVDEPITPPADKEHHEPDTMNHGGDMIQIMKHALDTKN